MAPSQSPFGRPLGVPSGLNTIDLADRGLNEGDDLSPYLDDFAGGGNAVAIPAGRYDLDDVGSLSLNTDEDAAIYAYGGQAVLDNREGALVNVSHGDAKIYYGNITLTGPFSHNGEWAIWALDDSEVECNHIHLLDVAGGQPERTGFYFRPEHEGHATLRNCIVQNASDNGIYGSSPGKTHIGNGDGAVWVLGGLYKNCNVSHVRLGSSGSRAEHVTIVLDGRVPRDPNGNCNARGLRIRDQGENIFVRDTHIIYDSVSCASMAVEVSHHIHNCDGSMEMVDCVIENNASNEAILMRCSGYDLEVRDTSIYGSGDLGIFGNVRTSGNCIGDGCKEARTEPVFVAEDGSVHTGDGTVVDPGDGGGSTEPPSDGGGGGTTPDLDHTLVINTDEDGPLTEYSFVTTGEVRAGPESELNNNDSITDNGDGTFTVRGATGNGFTDDWFFNGAITSFEVNTDPTEYTLVLDGDVVTRSEIVGGGPGTHHLMLDSDVFDESMISVIISDEVEFGPESSNLSDSIIENDDGTFTAVAGQLRQGDPDDFFYKGGIISFHNQSGNDIFAEVDGDGRFNTEDFDSLRPNAEVDTESDGLVFTFDASRSSAKSGKVVDYIWIVGGNRVRKKETTVEFSEPGEYTVKLIVIDSNGYADMVNIDVTADESPPQTSDSKPQAAFDYRTDGLTATLDASPSSDPDGEIQDYVWDFGPFNETGREVNVTFQQEGSYKVTLMVVDDNGVIDVASRTITVTEGGSTVGSTFNGVFLLLGLVPFLLQVI